MKNIRASLRFAILNFLWHIPGFRAYAEKRLPRHARGYRHYWESAEGKQYRMHMMERQQHLDENPSLAEIRAALDAHSPAKVLEVGCGYGRTLAALAPFYTVEGCDIAEDLLALVPKEIPTFRLDIVHPEAVWLEAHRGAWDVIFFRAVTMYFKENPEEMKRAMQTVEALAKKKVLVWEWMHVCDAMQKVYPSEKFEYHPLPVHANE